MTDQTKIHLTDPEPDPIPVSDGGRPAGLDSTGAESDHSEDPELARAVRLFEFLVEAQQQRTKTVYNLRSYSSAGGSVLDLDGVPLHPAVRAPHRESKPAPTAPFLAVERLKRVESPAPPEQIREWLLPNVDLSATDSEPGLRSEITVRIEDPAGHVETVQHSLESMPVVEEAFAQWLKEWMSWAKSEGTAERVRDVYTQIFKVGEQVASAPEDFELVLGLGRLRWEEQGQQPVDRHLVTMPVEVDLDDATGAVAIRSTAGMEVRVELDMLEPSRWPHQDLILEVIDQIVESSAHILDRDETALPLTRLVHRLDARGEYRSDAAGQENYQFPVVSFSPTLILRPRSRRGVLQLLQRIRDQLEESGRLPNGLRLLVGSEQWERDTASRDSGDEGLPEIYLPLPANDEQRRVAEQVGQRSQTVVQGPPGTGKTHTIANVLAHLLASGNRVLITAQTDRALRELRGKLPEELAALCVSVIGRDRSDLDDLRVAVSELDAKASHHDATKAAAERASLESRLDDLRRARGKRQRLLLEHRERETLRHEKFGLSGTLAEIADAHHGARESYGWIDRFGVDVSAPSPLSNSEARTMLTLMRDAGLRKDEVEARSPLPGLDSVLPPPDFDTLARAWRDADAQVQATAHHESHPSFPVLLRVDDSARDELWRSVKEVSERLARLAARPEKWMGQALAEILEGRVGIWEQRHRQINDQLAILESRIREVGPTSTIEVLKGDPRAFDAVAAELEAHLARGGKIKGLLLTPAPVKRAAGFLESVRVDGRRPETKAAVGSFLIWRSLKRVEKLWPANLTIPNEDTLLEQWAWNDGECRRLGHVIEAAAELKAIEEQLDALGIKTLNWTDPGSVESMLRAIEAATNRSRLNVVSAPIDALSDQLSHFGHGHEVTSLVVSAMQEAIGDRSPVAYRTQVSRLESLHATRRAAGERDEYIKRLKGAAPRVASTIEENPDWPGWTSRLRSLERAWAWAQREAWLQEKSDVDVDAEQKALHEVYQQIGTTTVRLTANLAWSAAVERLGRTQRQALKAYALAVRSVGKGKGKYAPHHHAEARRALRRCHDAVPAWVMPLYRIAETVDVQPDMFDVIIIDEASQAGVEASFLQYIAPRIVVVGDDKQVSPSGVGLDRQHLIDLRGKLLFDFPDAATWENPQISYFDQARLRTPDVITLREHFRCVPEIIGFSNRIAYEPDRVPLIPLRQFGRDRLTPILPRMVEEGYTRGTSGRMVNPPEAEALVDTIVECCADAAYKGKTMGVISLTGSAQADLIEQLLLDQLGAPEIKARELRCGDSASFQGAERDVMFLSMVAARDPARRMPALTSLMYLQRFNVAASRARDQMWVFHSVSLPELTNREGMRHQLLDYCYAVSTRDEDDGVSEAVPNDVLVEPFESLFEQRVFNRIVERGYNVVPQWEVYGFRIDLVVVGGTARLAVECDGDKWHGADQYEADMARQLELERCQWRFFRVRGSSFYRDPANALEPLWALLDEMGIHPRHYEAPEHEQESAVLRGAAASPDQADSAGGSGQEPQENEAAADEVAPLAPEPAVAIQYGRAPGSPQQGPRHQLPTAVVPPRDDSMDPAGLKLEPYVEWQGAGTIKLPTAATSTELRDTILDIVRVEGPILGDHLYQIYVKAADGNRVGKLQRQALNRATAKMVGAGLLAELNPLNEPGQGVKTFALPDHPGVRVRDLGARTVFAVPPSELAALMKLVHVRGRPVDDWFRDVLSVYGLTRLTGKTKARLEAMRELALGGRE